MAYLVEGGFHLVKYRGNCPTKLKSEGLTEKKESL